MSAGLPRCEVEVVALYANAIRGVILSEAKDLLLLLFSS
jgi:hypothetical protein